jgi:2-pyrone-4,6-dicarboxylate lactonase
MLPFARSTEAQIPNWQVPSGATDCHAHVFGPYSRFPLATQRNYTPLESDVHAYRTMLDSLGFTRAVIVQPSVYGTDNRATLAAVNELGLPCRAVIALDPFTPLDDIRALHKQGVRGVRVNFKSADVTHEYVRALARDIAPLGWHLQFFVDADSLTRLYPLMDALPVDCVIDHMGMVPAERGVDDPAFAGLLKLLGGRRTWVKLSAVYRISGQPAPHDDCAAMAKALYNVAPDRCLWGTDWPHPRVEPVPDVSTLLAAMCNWVGYDAMQDILVSNPSALYGF